MAFTVLSFVVAFLSYYALCNLSDVTSWTSLQAGSLKIMHNFVLIETFLMQYFKHGCHSNRLASKCISSFKIILCFHPDVK